MKNRILFVVVLALLALPFAGVFAQEQTIVEIAAGNENFSTLVSLVQQAGLADALAGEGPFTVFAPTNEAFAALPQSVLDFLGANPDLLTQVLSYHVVAGAAITSDQITERTEVETLEGSTVVAQPVPGGVRVGGANVVMADVIASNGVIHAIDAVLVPALELPAVDPLEYSDNIIAAGSSTVFPVTERMADRFRADGYAGNITVDSIGSGAGYERFCVNAETDIANASRPIRPAEVESCLANGLEPFGFFVAVDALAVVVSTENDFVDNLTVEQLAAIFSGEAATWADIDPSYPAEAIQLYSPGSDSGTYDYFVEEVFESDETAIQSVTGIQFSEDDNVLVAGVEGSPFAIGFFGYAYFQENQDRLRAVAIEGVEPNEDTGASGEYPLSRPLFIFSAPSILQAKPTVAGFVNYYLQNANAELGTGAEQIGYIPVPQGVQNRNALLWYVATGTPIMMEME